ncbi:transporter substrate-binding domain-containing protein [Halomonas urumqiensis]|uniref:Nickel transporter n=1 Tax=Halomonas urumqiensis TaxID=1684789 RepID=A0A2N7UMC9_9GAMM|nr:transporter substrate-binding domain-containing protein [Halomonas urumqiensis]PMR81603.1 nickel transporter [Halomonas urumqiensis]PTB02240.1 nickel transporter [Halomonas urumqiensis]GHE21705.1 ABC transporter substrate-binding protein [Halomonas urumqiensis]
MRPINLLLAATLAAGLTTTVQASEDELRLGVDLPYEPFMYRQSNGELAGFEIELGNAVCDYLDVTCTWVEQAWDGIIPGLMARKYDAIMSSMAITEERAAQVLFSEPYYTTPSAWITTQGREIDIDDRESLDDLVVGVQRATLQDNYVTELYGDVVEIRRYTSGDDVIADMRAGRLDLTFMDYPVAEAAMDLDSDESDFKRVSDFIKKPDHIFGEGVGLAFRKRDGELAERINAALAALKEDGTYDEIMNRYFNYDIKL